MPLPSQCWEAFRTLQHWPADDVVFAGLGEIFQQLFFHCMSSRQASPSVVNSNGRPLSIAGPAATPHSVLMHICVKELVSCLFADNPQQKVYSSLPFKERIFV